MYFMHQIILLYSLKQAGKIYQLLYFQSLVEPVPWYIKKEVMKDAKLPVGQMLAAAAAFALAIQESI